MAKRDLNPYCEWIRLEGNKGFKRRLLPSALSFPFILNLAWRHSKAPGKEANFAPPSPSASRAAAREAPGGGWTAHPHSTIDRVDSSRLISPSDCRVESVPTESTNCE